MAGLAGHIGFREQGLVTVVRCGIVFTQIRRMTDRAARIPVLEGTGPVDRIPVRDRIVRVEVQPPLSAFGFGAAVPDDVQRLVSSVLERNQVLLQGMETEGPCNFEFLQFTLPVVGLDVKLAVLAVKTAFDPSVFEGPVGEIAQYVFLVSGKHGLEMMRCLPGFPGLGMAAGALRAADKFLRLAACGGHEGKDQQADQVKGGRFHECVPDHAPVQAPRAWHRAAVSSSPVQCEKTNRARSSLPGQVRNCIPARCSS